MRMSPWMRGNGRSEAFFMLLSFALAILVIVLIVTSGPWTVDARPGADQSAPGARGAGIDSADQLEHQLGQGAELGLSISGAVIDDSGERLSNIQVIARPLRDHRSELITSTDPLGRFAFNFLSAGEYQLEVTETESRHAGQLRVRAGVNNAELRLQRKRSVPASSNSLDTGP